jgi:type III restriction enzyme
MINQDNPILNNPYIEPQYHYKTNDDRRIMYNEPPVPRRHTFSFYSRTAVRKGKENKLFTSEEVNPVYAEDRLVDRIREEVGEWRKQEYPNITRITKTLLNYWFLNPERSYIKSLFFAQQEVIETTIWLNEVANKSNAGTKILESIAYHNKLSGKVDTIYQLPRFAFKMATGTGKSTVMAVQLLYHFFNRQTYPRDVRFADFFVIITPNITIKDRLAELRDLQQVNINQLQGRRSVYVERDLIPPDFWEMAMALPNHIFITNFQQLQPRDLSGNLVGAFDKKETINLNGDKNAKSNSKESFSKLFKRVLPTSFKVDSRLLVINDEAHHCYCPMPLKEKKKAGEVDEKENDNARSWITAIAQLGRRFKLQNVYDLSATPYFISGSGQTEGTLFPWIVSDFGLVEAMESGLIKIPFFPELENEEVGKIDPKNFWEYIKNDMPNARTPEKEEYTLPSKLIDALDMFYEHYEKTYKDFSKLFGINPVMIIVCPNTRISKEVYKLVAGYEKNIIDKESRQEEKMLINGQYALFNNHNEDYNILREKPATLLIDSKALESADDKIDDSFRKIFAREISQFEKEYKRTKGVTEAPSEKEIVREVLNTVGRKGKLGADIHCVISVGMLTEGWDANTVTHIFGLRAFGSQLLCEQVIGRALRRTNYELNTFDKEGNITTDKRKIVTEKYPPEYAYILGIPFDFATSPYSENANYSTAQVSESKRIFAVPQREHLEIVCPQVTDYRYIHSEDKLEFDEDSFNQLKDFYIEENERITEITLASSLSNEKQILTLEEVKQIRHQKVIFSLTQRLIEKYFFDVGDFRYYQFPNLYAVVEKWYHEKLRMYGNKVCKQMVLAELDRAVTHIHQIIRADRKDVDMILPVLSKTRPYIGTESIDTITTKPTFNETVKSHINKVVCDTEEWEQNVALNLENHPAVQSYVKNFGLGFSIPYIDSEEKERNYQPDFIVKTKGNSGKEINLIIELTGSNWDEKDEKAIYLTDYWLKSINQYKNLQIKGSWEFLHCTSLDRFTMEFNHKLQKI